MEIKDLLIQKLAEYYIKNGIGKNGVVPIYSDVYNKYSEKLNNIFLSRKIPEIVYKSSSSLSEYTLHTNDIIMLISSIGLSINDIVREHQKVTRDYNDICIRIDNEATVFKQMISKMLTYSCFYIDNTDENQLSSSVCGKIGKYTTLPFFVNSTVMYNDNISIMASSVDELKFSNFESIRSLPLKEFGTAKILGSNSIVNFNINISINLIKANGIYVKFANNIKEMTITLFKNTNYVKKFVFDSNEVFINFIPEEFDSISISLKCNNPNPSKTFPIQLRSLEIFKSIRFAKYGSFQSKAIHIAEVARVDYIGIEYQDYGDKVHTKTDSLLSVSSDPNYLSYRHIEKNEYTDISLIKYKNSKLISNYNNIGVNQTSKEYKTIQKIGNDEYYRIPILNNSDIYTMNHQHSVIFHGLNAEYGLPDNKLHFNTMYENWTKVGNFYKTFIVNYEDNVNIDIGQKTCFLNSKQVTGKIKIPVGISSIDVHVKDIDFKFGKNIAVDKFNGISDKTIVYSDNLFPFNFAYMFAGLPDYNDTTNTISQEVIRQFDIASPTTLFLDEPFIPLSVSVTDSIGFQYSLQLTKGTSTGGTFSIEPHFGKIRVCPRGGNKTSVTIRYRRASLTRRPCGILFNRLLSFIPCKALMGQSFKDNTLFTIDTSSNSKSLLIQKIPDVNIQHSHIMFNKLTDKIYAAIKLDMTSDNPYLTPIINDIYITTG